MLKLTKSISIKNPGAHFTLKILVNQRFGIYPAQSDRLLPTKRTNQETIAKETNPGGVTVDI